MTWTHPRWPRGLISVALTGSLAAIGLIGLTTPASASTASSPAVRAVTSTAADRTTFLREFVLARKLPRDAVAGIRAGSLRVATDSATHTSWAMAEFAPAATIGTRLQTDFQDGANIAVFSQSGTKPWQLTSITGAPFSCSRALPASVLAAWHLTRLASCGVTPAAAKRQAQQARTTLRASASARASSTKASSTSTASLGQDIASIALNQVGVSDVPDVYDFDGVDCDPYSTMDGPPTPNANGCGVNPNFKLVNEDEEWCSDFAKWVWQQAGVTADINTLNAGADSFYLWGSQQGEPLTVDSGSPAVGDAVVFYEPGAITTSTYADHVGIVTAVNADGTISMVNGDFLGSTNISVQYDTDIDLATWAPEVWSPGEQWVFVSPPSAAQQAAPTEKIISGGNVVAGTAMPFAVAASVPGGSISSYLWTFGDGVTATGPVVSHVFGDPGEYSVAVTATSSFGTATTTTANVDVVGSSSDVSSVDSDQVWYTTAPLLQDVYLASASGGLSEEAWDGASWLDQAIPGQPSGTHTATLTYPGADDTFVPQVFFRAAGGSLAQTSGGDGDWSTSEIAGQPAAGSALAATTVNDASSPRGASPEVFYFSAAGQLSETSGTGGTWTASTLPGPATSQTGALTETNATVGGTPVQEVFYADNSKDLTVTSSGSGGWTTAQIKSPFGVASGTPLAALSSGPDGLVQNVFFTGASGQVADAASVLGTGVWAVTKLPGPAASTGGLTAADYQLSTGATSAQVFYISSSGQLAEDSQSGLSWQSSTLPGTATGLLGAGAFPAAGGSEQVFSTDGTAVSEDATTSSGGAWTASSLPATPVSDSGRILLYAATPAGYQVALNAAAAAGLPAAQVTDNFEVAWAATLSGNYLVLVTDTAALDALYVNQCGWANPSGDDLGTTPFYYYVPPVYGLPGADAYVDATAATASDAQAVATDATYYAVHDAWPSGVTSIPAAGAPDFECEGSPS